MHLPAFDYLRPGSLGEALELLAQHGERAALLSGGTDLLIGMRQRLATPAVVVGLGAVAELKRFEVTPDGGLVIGAGCLLSTLAGEPVLRERYPSLAAAIQAVGSRHVRNMATLGGNLCLPTRCWYTNQSESWRAARPPCFKTGGDICYVIRSARECFAVNSVDSAPALITLGACVALASRAGIREVPLADFYRNDGIRPTVLGHGEILTAIHVPPARLRTCFIKLAQRRDLDYGLGTVAVAVAGSNRRVSSARLCLGSIAAAPVSLGAAARLIEDGGLTPATIAAAVETVRGDLAEITNLYSTAGYKRRILRVLVSRALEDVRRQKLPAGEGE
jgi:4-hydroxybenzoyl-CoA reductase subunit beta